jgi:invasion protein IalB
MQLKRHYLIPALSLSLLLAVTSAQAIPKVGDKFGDWVFECTALAANQTHCVLSQTLIQNESKQRVLRVALNKPAESKELQLVAVAPLGIYLPAGLTATIDKKTTVPFILKTCTQQGCIATANVDSKLVKSLTSGKNIELSFSANADSKPITLNVSLNGITTGISALSDK